MADTNLGKKFERNFGDSAKKDGIFTHRSFSLNSKKAGEQKIPFENIEDFRKDIIKGVKGE